MAGGHLEGLDHRIAAAPEAERYQRDLPFDGGGQVNLLVEKVERRQGWGREWLLLTAGNGTGLDGGSGGQVGKEV